MRVLAIEPWNGGSHARFLEAWRERSEHRVDVLGLAPRHWRWRMEGGAWTLADRAAALGAPPDVLFVSDYLDLPRFRGFLPPAWRPVPALAYFHENQLTFPPPPDEERDERDLALGFANVLTLIAAEDAAFNTRFHLEDFGDAARELMRRLPRPRPADALEASLARATVIHPGVDLNAMPLGPGPGTGAPLRVAWCHRWEHDKDPAAFLHAVLAARERGAELELVLLGPAPEKRSRELEGLVARVKSMVYQRGFAADRVAYANHLGRCDVVVSTARHEFYGISMLEAVATGCAPLAPRRLAYPETLTGALIEGLYEDEAELVERLVRMAADPAPLRKLEARAARSAAIAGHDVSETARALDARCAALFASTTR